MQQKILGALDDYPNAMLAVEQVASTDIPNNVITLNSVLPQADFGCIRSISQKVLHAVKDKSVLIVGEGGLRFIQNTLTGAVES